MLKVPSFTQISTLQSHRELAQNQVIMDAHSAIVKETPGFLLPTSIHTLEVGTPDTGRLQQAGEATVSANQVGSNVLATTTSQISNHLTSNQLQQ